MTRVLIDIEATPEALGRIEALGAEVVRARPSLKPRELPPELIRDADVLVCNRPPINHRHMRAVKLIQLTSVGYSQLYGLDLVARGVRACNARGVYDTAIAEWNVMMMLTLARDLRGMIRNQEHGIWSDASDRFHTEIRGRVVGVWGYGGIGRETARLAKTMGLTVHAFVRRAIRPREQTFEIPGTGDPDGRLPDRVFTSGEEHEFLRGLDFLILCMPLTPENEGLIGEEELRQLQPTAFLLNPARGPIVQEAALLRALRDGWFAGAALDTHYYYPMPADHPLWRFPNVIMTPHISGSDRGPHFLARLWSIALHNIEHLLSGGPLLNELTPEELEPPARPDRR